MIFISWKVCSFKNMYLQSQYVISFFLTDWESSNVNEVIKAVLNFFLRKDHVRTKRHRRPSKSTKTQISE